MTESLPELLWVFESLAGSYAQAMIVQIIIGAVLSVLGLILILGSKPWKDVRIAIKEPYPVYSVTRGVSAVAGGLSLATGAVLLGIGLVQYSGAAFYAAQELLHG